MNILDVENLLKYMHSTYLKVWYNNTLPFKFSKVSEVNEDFRLSEKMVQAIWNDSKFLKNKLIDDSQRELKIISQGTWNREPGPDFKNAVIEIDGRKVYGDIEIHLSPGHWKSHGHHYDPNYRNVILHVVWEMKGNKFPPSIPHLELSSQLCISPDEVYRLTNLSEYSKSRIHPAEECSEIISLIPDSSLKTIFQAAGLSRLHRKSIQFKHSVSKFGLAQAFYTSLADALGFKNNRSSFKKLTELASLKVLKETNKMEERSALLWGLSGLLPDISQQEIHSELSSLAEEKWHIWWRLREDAETKIKWNRTSQRPLNSPERRLAALECILNQTNFEPEEIVKNSLKLLHRHDDLKDYLFDVFDFESHWDKFCNFKTKLKNSAKLIGQTRKLDIIINVILPAMASQIDDEDQKSLNSLYLFYCKLPKSQNNHVLDIAAHKFFIPPYRSKEIIKRAVEQQGLMQLMQDFDLPDRPDEVLAFWEELGISIQHYKSETLREMTV